MSADVKKFLRKPKSKAKKSKAQEDLDLSSPRTSLFVPLNTVRCSSMTNIANADDTEGMMDAKTVMFLGDTLKNFKEAMERLKRVFMDVKEPPTEKGITDMQLAAQDKLGDLLSQMENLKAFPVLISNSLLMAAAAVIDAVKEFKDFHNRDIVLLRIDDLANELCKSTAELLSNDLCATTPSHVSHKAKSENNVGKLGLTSINGKVDHGEKKDVLPADSELDKHLFLIDKGVEAALIQAKGWGLYAKKVCDYVEKRGNLTMDYAKNMAKAAIAAEQGMKDDYQMPFQSIFLTAMSHDIRFSTQCQATHQVVLSHKFIDLVNARRLEHDKIRKLIGNKWSKENKRVTEGISYLQKSHSQYINRHLDYEKAIELTIKATEAAESQTPGTTGSNAAIAKLEKKKKIEEEAQTKALDAEVNYKSWIVEANNRQAELERLRGEILAEIRTLMYESERVMKSATLDYFEYLYADISTQPEQFLNMWTLTGSYRPGMKYASFVMSIRPQNPARKPDHYVFKPYYSDVKPAAETRKHSTHSSGSGSDGVADDSPRLKKKGHESDNDSGSMSSPGQTSPYLQHGVRNPAFSDFDPALHGPGSSVSKPRLFGGVHLSRAARNHTFSYLRSASTSVRCRHCDSLIVNNAHGAECDKCGLVSHTKCLEQLTVSECASPRFTNRRTTTFGVELESLLKKTHTDVPPVVTYCTKVLEEKGLGIMGLYRVSSVKSKVQSLCQSFENDPTAVDLSEHNQHLLANVLKHYMRELPEPLLTFRLYNQWIQLARDEQAHQWTEEVTISKLKEILQTMPVPMWNTLAVFIRHLNKVTEFSAENQMSATNLGICLGPSLLRPSDGANMSETLADTPYQAHIIELMIIHCNEIFNESEEESADAESPQPKEGAVKAMSVPEITESLLDDRKQADVADSAEGTQHDQPLDATKLQLEHVSRQRSLTRHASDPAMSPTPNLMSQWLWEGFSPRPMPIEHHPLRSFSKSMFQKNSCSMSDLRHLTQPKPFAPGQYVSGSRGPFLTVEFPDYGSLQSNVEFEAFADVEPDVLVLPKRYAKLSSPVKKELTGHLFTTKTPTDDDDVIFL